MSPEPAWPWSVLGLPRKPATLADVRRAYARSLKAIDQATDIAGFTALRAAYEDATRRMSATAAARKPPLPQPVPAPVAVAVPVPAPVPAPMPVAVAAPAPTPTPPIAPPVANPHIARQAAFDALLNTLQTHSVVAHMGDRILAALADPLATDPEFEPALRRTIANMLRNQLQPDGENGLYLSSSLRPAVHALNQRFHWLSDYTAFRRDFWDHPLLLDAMMGCAGLRAAKPRENRRPGRTIGPREQKLNNALGGMRFGYGLVAFFVVIFFLSGFTNGTAWEGPLRWVLVTGVVGIIVFAIGVLAYTSFATLQYHLRERLEKLQDRRALRRKGLLPPAAPLLARLRANPNIWVYVAFGTSALFVLWALLANA